LLHFWWMLQKNKQNKPSWGRGLKLKKPNK
jgi:hypothetical protein